MNANRFALTNVRPAAGRGAVVRAGCPMGVAMDCRGADRTLADLCLPAVPASLWLQGYEEQTHPGEGSA